MISQNPYSNCMSARLYYYDFLNEENKESIPESTLRHIEDCPDCQVEIGRLEILLAKVDKGIEDQQSRRNSAITSLLKFHFAHVDEPVTCNTLKPFLASLADPVLQIRIPTPITRHIDECEHCRADFQTLRDLHLTHEQLCRLGQLLAEKPANRTVDCGKARLAIPAVASMVFRETDAETLKHLSTCPDCREELFRRREDIRRELLNNGIDRDKIPCEAVTPSDIYDYAFPYGIDPADDEYAEFREPLASHLSECPTCLAKVQQLQETIYSIIERPESGVVTVYHVEEPVPAGAENNAERIPPGTIINVTARLKRGLSSPWFKATAVAAAVVIIALILIPFESTVTAVSYDRMSNAIKRAKNFHISTFDPDKTEAAQEKWLSRSLQFFLSKDEKGFILSDFTDKLRKARPLGNELVEEEELPENTFAAIERNVAVFLNLLPFERMSEAPEGSSWIPVVDDGLIMAGKNSDVYDFTWTDRSYRDSLEYNKRRYFINPETGIPNRIQFYTKFSEDDEYTLQSEMVVELLSDDEMQSVIKNAFP